MEVQSSEASRQEYNRLWKSAWGDMQHFGPVHRHQRRALISMVRRLGVSTVLDVGCGSGENLAALRDAFPGLMLSGIDISPEALALSAKRVSGVNLEVLDVQKQKLTSRFDLVMSLQVIEHLEDDVAALRRMGEMAERWVLVTTMRGRMRPSERAIGHMRNYTNKDLRQKAETAGLQVSDLFGWGFPFYSPLYRSLAEWLPGGPPQGTFGKSTQTAAQLLNILYYLNIPRLGDVVTLLARPRWK
ncbi:MAG TPA: class I SAM-dependent methyltransferase [Terriglobia bacterium]|nr:class I SAM-dependent methyltransferase [Terriglobia bacterium]